MARRRVTRQTHQQRINDVLHYIHAHLSEALEITQLAQLSCYSIHHFQRIFKMICGESVHDYIRRSRLEWAANLLVFNPESTVMAVAGECGFQSNASFCHAFKGVFGVSPSAWRDAGYRATSLGLKRQWSNSMTNPNRHYYQRTYTEEDATRPLTVDVRKHPPMRVAYIRHVGYDRSIGDVWQKLLAWVEKQERDPESSAMIGLYHSNPDIIPYEQCRYVACVGIPETVYRDAGVNVMDIPGGLFACCRGKGRYGDLIYMLHKLYHHWLPESEFETINLPAHAEYFKNHFLTENGEFDAELRVPVRYKF